VSRNNKFTSAYQLKLLLLSTQASVKCAFPRDKTSIRLPGVSTSSNLAPFKKSLETPAFDPSESHTAPASPSPINTPTHKNMKKLSLHHCFLKTLIFFFLFRAIHSKSFHLSLYLLI